MEGEDQSTTQATLNASSEKIHEAESLSQESGAELDRIDISVDTTTISAEIHDDDNYSDEYESFTHCEVDGTLYDHLADVPSSDPCELCQCIGGKVICAVDPYCLNINTTSTTEGYTIS